MTMRILFNGTSLVKPGGATKVDASLFASAGLSGQGVVGVVGEADEGEPNALHIFTSSELARAYFKSGPLADAADLAFKPGNDDRVPGGAQTLVCVKTNQSVRSYKLFKGAGVASGSATSANAAPFNLEPAQTLKVKVDGAGATTATFNATAATKAGAGATYNAPTGKTLLIKVDNGEVQTYTATAGATAAAALAAEINSQIRGLQAVVNGAQVDLKSDKRGTGSKIEITGGTGNVEFGQAVASASGTGNVADINAVTAAEVKAVVEAAIATLTVTGSGTITLTSKTTGETSSIQIDGTGTATAIFGFDTDAHAGSAPIDVLKITAKKYGVDGDKISVAIGDSGGGKTVTESYEDAQTRLSQSSAVLGAVPEMTVQYKGDGATAVMVIDATGLTITIAGQTDGSASLSVPFSTYKTLAEVVNYINRQVKTDGSAAYEAALPTNNPYSAFLSANLDHANGVDAKAAPVGCYAKLARVIEWLNKNSTLVTAALEGTVRVPPSATVTTTPLTSGSRGVSTNTHWQNAFNALLVMRVHQVVPLASEDLANEGHGSSATITSIAAMLDSHVAFASSTRGKNERQGFLGFKGTKTATLAQACILNSIHTCVTSQRLTRMNAQNEMVEFPEWSFALVCAGMRAGSELGEPLTWKYLRTNDVSQDASWNPTDHGEEMILGGVMFAEKVPNKGWRICKGITSYTREENDAYTEESVVQGWKNVAYELRTHIENLFTGRRASPSSLRRVRSQAIAKLSELRSSGQIVDSVEEDGSTLYAYRDLSIRASGDTVYLNVTVSPVSGINFTLNTIYLVPAQINA